MAMDFSLQLQRLQDEIETYKNTPRQEKTERSELEGRIGRLVSDLQNELEAINIEEPKNLSHKITAKNRINHLMTDFFTKQIQNMSDDQMNQFHWSA